MEGLPQTRRCRRATRCTNDLDGGLTSHARLLPPTMTHTFLASSADDELRLQSERRAFEGGQRYTDSNGRCLYGHTDWTHWNETEHVVWFSEPSSAGRCGHCTGALLLPETYTCACVSAERVANALAVEWHHEVCSVTRTHMHMACDVQYLIFST